MPFCFLRAVISVSIAICKNSTLLFFSLCEHRPLPSLCCSVIARVCSHMLWCSLEWHTWLGCSHIFLWIFLELLPVSGDAQMINWRSHQRPFLWCLQILGCVAAFCRIWGSQIAVPPWPPSACGNVRHEIICLLPARELLHYGAIPMPCFPYEK